MFAVVTFHDDTTSEVPSNWLIDFDEDGSSCWWPPSNTKNLSTLISKRIEPVKSTWQRLSVNLGRFCNTLEKARKIAEDSQYTSANEEELGRGRRKRFSKKLSQLTKILVQRTFNHKIKINHQRINCLLFRKNLTIIKRHQTNQAITAVLPQIIIIMFQ
ncbi:uncharacterized protein LOC113563263 [Ooceraea biroi]|uniref:uncharacterized protein LOC113563263 n=1 Tax=Ooceraea biroi TaxID=2015173 RepID=UPI000F0764C0|nr:uncharacterized protein LOC113563263 [Ooceraea biroi]